MDPLIILSIAVPVLVVLAVLGFRHLGEEAERKEQAQRRAALTLGGQFLPAAWLTQDKIRYAVRGRCAEMEFHRGSDDDPSYTRATIDMRGLSRGTVKICPEGFGSSIAKFFGAQDIEVGDREFDALYVVKSTPEALARSLFSAANRARVIALIRGLGRRWETVVDLSREALTLRVGAVLDREPQILDLARAAEDLFDLLASSAETVAVAWIEAPPSAGGQCQVCGTGMEQGVVRCAKCRTPHHKECWEFNGQCSTFACGSHDHA